MKIIGYIFNYIWIKIYINTTLKIKILKQVNLTVLIICMLIVCILVFFILFVSYKYLPIMIHWNFVSFKEKAKIN